MGELQADVVSVVLHKCVGQLIFCEYSLPVDILQLRFACRELGDAVDPHSVVLGFACTRPGFGGLQLNLQQWSEVWGACAAAVELQGLDVSAWGHAIEFSLVEKDFVMPESRADLGNYRFLTHLLEPRLVADWIDIVIATRHVDIIKIPTRTAWILSLAGFIKVDMDPAADDRDDSPVVVRALVILSDGRFAVVCVSYDDNGEDIEGHVGMDHSLAALAPPFEQDMGGRLFLSEYQFSSLLGHIARLDYLPRIARSAAGNRLMRRAGDAYSYSHLEFFDWYAWHFIDPAVFSIDDNSPTFADRQLHLEEGRDFADIRWQEAAPLNPAGDRFAAMVRQVGNVGAPASSTPRASASPLEVADSIAAHSPGMYDPLDSAGSIVAAELLDDPASAVIDPQYIGVEGEEPAADVMPDEADNTSRELWASGVEHLIHQEASQSAQSHHQSFDSEGPLVLLTFGRFPKQMQDALKETYIATILLHQGHAIQPSWANGSFVLAEGVDEHVVAEALENFAEGRGNWHIVVREVHENQIYEALKYLPYNIRPRVKPGCRFPIPENADSTLFGDISAESSSELTHDNASMTASDGASAAGGPEIQTIYFKRTFLHIPPVPMGSVSPRTIRTV